MGVLLPLQISKTVIVNRFTQIFKSGNSLFGVASGATSCS